MRIFYSSLTGLLSFPLAVVFLLYARGRQRLKERFGLWQLDRDRYVWFHAASNGEIRGLLPVIRSYKALYPDKRLLLTATSPSALELAASEGDVLRLLPFDSELWYRLAVGNVEIERVVISETEIWPGLFWFLNARAIPLTLVNGQISDYSWPRYRFFRMLLRKLLPALKSVMVTDQVSKERFLELGVSANSLQVTGNSKYDFQPSVSSHNQANELRSKFFANQGPVITLASLWPGEEEFWFPVIHQILFENERVQFVIAPRHVERFEYFAGRLQASGIEFSRRSQLGREGRACSKRVLLLDSLGELEPLFSFSVAAFIGGSLVDVGGHNPLEASAYGIPVAMGAYHSKVRPIVADLVKANALQLVQSVQDVRLFIDKVLDEGQLRNEGALEVWQEYSGATRRIVEALAEQVA